MGEVARIIQDQPYKALLFIALTWIGWFIHSTVQQNSIKIAKRELSRAKEEIYRSNLTSARPSSTASPQIPEVKSSANSWLWLLLIPAAWVGYQALPSVTDAVNSVAAEPIAISGKLQGIGQGPFNSNNYSLAFDMAIPALTLTNENSGVSYFFSGETRRDGEFFYINGKLKNNNTYLGIPIEGQLSASRFQGTIITVTGQYKLDLVR